VYVSRSPARWSRGGVCTARQQRVELVAVGIKARQSVGEIRSTVRLTPAANGSSSYSSSLQSISPALGFPSTWEPTRTCAVALLDMVTACCLFGRFRRSSPNARSDHVLACAGRQQHEASLAWNLAVFSDSLQRYQVPDRGNVRQQHVLITYVF
jgi:hypothetical protein